MLDLFGDVYIAWLSRYKGQKHEVWEGGVHVAGWVNGGLVPAHARGSTHTPLIHVSDWAPTIMHILAGVDMAAGVAPGMALDGVSMWACLTAESGTAKQAACESAGRRDILYNVNLLCDDPSASPTPGSMDFLSEVPAPKAGLRVGDMVLLAECYDWRTKSLRGRKSLYNVTAV